MVVKPTFGNRLKDLRTSKNLTLDEFSKLLNVPAQTLNRYELGQRTPKIDVVYEISEKLQVNPIWLSGYELAKDDELIVLAKYLKSIGYEFEFVYAEKADYALSEITLRTYDSNGNLQLPPNIRRSPCIKKGNSSIVLSNEQFIEFNKNIKHAIDYELSKFSKQ